MSDADETKQEAPAAPAAPAAGFGPIAQAVGPRNLVIIIVTMPIFFLLVVMATISVFGRPGEKDGAALSSAGAAQTVDAPSRVLSQPAPAMATPPTFASVPAPLQLPEGAKIGAMALDGDRLALRVDEGADGEIVIYDLAKGAVVQRVKVQKSTRPNL